MNKFGRFLLFAVFLAMVCGVFVWKKANLSEEAGAPVSGESRPRMVQVTSPGCPPCLLMEPTIKRLKVEFRGKADFEVLDITVNPEAVEKYGIRTTPTQVFIDPSGREVFRHEGLMYREEIVRVFKEMGVE